MPLYYVWSIPKLVRVIEAANKQEAASVFLDEPASAVPIADAPPACFVQANDGLRVPIADETTVEFWPSDEPADVMFVERNGEGCE